MSNTHTRYNITVYSYRKRLADPDGISAKAAIDGLVHCKILQDDSLSFVKEVRYIQEKAQENKTVIILEEVEE